jgi:hypothetical protein
MRQNSEQNGKGEYVLATGPTAANQFDMTTRDSKPWSALTHSGLTTQG